MISNYNIFYSNSFNYYVINLYKWKLLKISELTYSSLINNDELKVAKNEKKMLTLNGIIIPDGINEYELFLDTYYSEIYNKKLHLTILASTSCNFNCKYCYEEYKSYSINNNFVEAMKMFVLKSIKSYKSIYIEWFGGEPLLSRRELIKLSEIIFDICNKEKKPYLGSIVTNGYYLDLDTFYKLINTNIIYFQVTIDGNEEMHNKLRPLKSGRPTYNTILNNLISIRDNTPKNRYFKIVIRNNVYKENEIEARDFIRIFKDEFINDSRFSLYQFPIKNWGGEKVNDIKNDLLINDGVYFTENKYSYSNINESISGRICYAAKDTGFTIDPQLNIYKCSHYIQDIKCPEKYNKIGFINNNGQLKLNDELKSQWNIRNVNEKCKECQMVPYCVIEKCPIYNTIPYQNCIEKNREDIINKIKIYLNTIERKGVKF